MKKRILLIDNHQDPQDFGAPRLAHQIRQFMPPQSQLKTQRGPEGNFSLNPLDFDLLVLSGSKTSFLSQEPWVLKLTDYLQKVVQEKKPILGICFGHQLLAHALGGKGSSCQRIDRAVLLTIKYKSTLFPNIGQYTVSASHEEEIQHLPASLKTTALSETTNIEAFEGILQPVFGVQFHPEKLQTDTALCQQIFKIFLSL